ncbi:MAG: SpoIIE family protein phosphatase [Bacteroidetes bacterium]|nr:SpoIIE family protein phosphatase [Bacteroidota bacterium]
MSYFKYTLCTILLVALIKTVSAQNSRQDVLRALPTVKTDSAKVMQLIILSEYCDNEDTDTSIIVGNSALDIALKTGKNALISNAYLKIGITYQNRSDYQKASVYFFKALKLAENIADYHIKARIFNSIANSFAYLKQYDMALEYFTKAYDIYKDAHDTKKLGAVLMNLGNIYYTKNYNSGDFTTCYHYYHQAEKLAEETKDYDLLNSVYGNLALVYSDDKRYNDALSIIEKGMKLAEKFNNKENKMFLDYYAGRTYGHMGQIKKAEVYFNESIQLAQDLKNLDYVSENYLCLSEAYYESGRYKEAYDAYEKYKTLEDSLMSKENSRQLNELKTIYETDKKEKELELSNQKLQTQDIKLEKQQTIIFSSVGGALLLLVLALVFYSRYQLKQKANHKLETAYAIIEEKNKDITDSINYAQKIQHAILPEREELEKVLGNVFVLFKPRDIVSGDFYWCCDTPDRRYIAAVDCTGHGVPGAMMSMIGSSLLNQIVNEKKISGTANILNELREGIKTAFKLRDGRTKQRDGMDMAILGFDPDMKRVEFSGANNGLYLIRDNALQEFAADKQPIGQHEGHETPFKSTFIELQPDDCLYMYTDGYADQFGGEKGKKYKYSSLKELLLKIHHLPMNEQYQVLDRTFQEWKAALEQVDDVLIIGIKI